MILNMSGGGGGGGLNFEVKAYASASDLPYSAKGNTIAIVTDTAITGWIFSPVEPESPVAGMVWIPNGVEGANCFNAIKKNTLLVYPAGCKQHINGAFKNVAAHIYIDGWNQFAYEREYLYNNGETSLAWVGRGTNTDTALVMTTQHGNHGGSYSSHGWKSSETLVTVPNGATKLCIKYGDSYSEGKASDFRFAYLGLSNKVYSSFPESGTTEFAAYASIENTGSDITAEMPITSALHGSAYYVGIKVGTGGSNVRVVSSWTITEIWFE